MDANTSVLRTISATTQSILEAVQSGGSSSNYLTTDGEQTVSNKTLDNTNIFPITLATTTQLQSALNTMEAYAEANYVNRANPVLTNPSLAVIVDSIPHNIAIPIGDGDDTLADLNSSQSLSNKQLRNVTLFSPTGNLLTLPTEGTLASTDDIPEIHLYNVSAALDSNYVNIARSSFYIKTRKLTDAEMLLEVEATLGLVNGIDYTTQRVIIENIFMISSLSSQYTIYDTEFNLNLNTNTNTVTLFSSSVSSASPIVLHFHKYIPTIYDLTISDTYKVF